MSESIKTFWFDLQRFAVTLFLDEAGAGKSKYVHANTEIPTEDPTDAETGKAAKGQYFWESTDVIEAGENTKITFSTATKESATYTVESGDSTSTKNYNYYTVALDDATKLEDLRGVSALGIGSGSVRLEFGYANEETGGKKDAVALSDGEMTAVTLATANTTLLVGGADGEDFSINGSAVNVEGAEGYTYIFVKSGGNNSLDVSNGEAGSVTVSKAGDAKILYVPTTAAEAGEIQIGDDTFTYTGGGEGGEDGATGAYFKLDGKSKVNGFVFVNGGEDGITLSSGASLSLYYLKGSKETEVPSALSISGVDEYAITATGEAGSVTGFAVEVADGANVKLGSTTFDFGIEADHEETGLVSIGFSTKGSLEGVYGLLAGDAVTVAGGPDKGVIFAAEAGDEAGVTVKVASGNFVYGLDADSEDGLAILTLTQNADSVTALDGVEAGIRVVPAEGTTTVTILKDTFSFTNTSGEAYFFTETGAQTDSFHFGGEGDAITFTKKTKADAEFGLTYNIDDEEVALDAAPTVDKYPYTIELTTLGEDEADTVFQIADIADKSKVTFGEDGGVFTFGGDGGSVKFNGAGEASGFVAAEGGTVTLDTAASAFLEAADEDNPFTINEVAINIVGEAGTKGLVYDDNDKSLNGFAEGDIEIIDAGVVKKIFTPKGEAGFTFGEDGEQELTVNSKKGTSFLTVDGNKATGFTFVEVEDAITGDFSDFKLYDGVDDTEGFAAPKVTDEEGEAITEATITKVKTGFEIAAEQGYNIEFADGTKLTFEAVDAESASVVFDKKGALVSVTGLTAADDKMIVEGATGQVSVDGAAYEITGAAWTYQMNEDTEVTIRDLKSGVKVVNSGEAVELWTAGGENGTFQFGSASAYTVSGADNDTVEGEAGIRFFWDGAAVTGIGSMDDNTSVAGAMNGLTFNDNTEALAITDGTYTVFGGGQSLAGLKAGSEITAQGGVSDFITIEEGKFTFGSEYEIKGDKEVTFTLADLKLQAINGLGGSAIGDFTGGLSVNSQAVEVTGDATIAVVGNEETVTEIHQLGGKGVEIVSAGEASLIGANEDGDFTFTFAGGTSFALEGNKAIETTFTLTEGVVTAIDGLDDGEIVAGGFSTAIKVEGKEIEVANDPMISIVGGASKAITGLSDGAEVKQAGGAKFAVTDEEGSFIIGGKSFAIKGDNEVTFVLDADGNVTGINGLDDAATVTGDLNGITVNEGDPFDIRDNTNYSYSPNTGVSGVVDTNTVKSADGAKNVWVGGASFTVTFENGVFQVDGESDGVNFLVKDTNIAIAVESLDAGATMSGDFSQLTSVNGVSFAVVDGDNSISIVGAADGIGQILGLTAEAKVANAGGASLAKTDKAGAFTFGSQSAYTTAGDDEVTFGLNDKGEVETISELSGAVTGSFSGITGINDKTFSVKDADGVLTVYGNESEDDISKIADVTGDAVIGEVGSVSQVLTDAEGKFEFTVGGQSFTTGDGAKEVTFGLSASKVVSIDKLNGSAIGSFSGIAVNGAEIDITDGNNILKVFGDGTKLTAIEDVDADATINKAGGVAQLVGIIGASSGSFTFADSGEFVVEGDDQVTFVLNTEADAEVTGIAGLKGAVTGSFSGISSINGKTFDVKDADGILTVYGNAAENDITKIEGVTAEATIGEIGGVSQIITDSAGKFTFNNGSWSIAGDTEVTFGMSASKVIAISDLVGTVTGGFSSVTVNGKSVQISGDSSIALIGSASGVSEIQSLTGGAVISAADGISVAKTDKEGAFTFADGKVVNIAGDDEVTFELDGKGNLVSIQDLEESATVSGDLNGIAIGDGEKFSVEADNKNLWYSQGTLSGVVDGNTVYSANGATTVQVAGDGVYTFGSDAFEIAGDQDGIVEFLVKDASIVTGVNELDENASITGALNGLTINDSAALNVENDSDFGAVAGASGVAKLFDISNGANVIAAGGASQFITDEEGNFTILGTAMEIADDDSVKFTADEDGITAIDDLQGTAIGDFTEEIQVNENGVQVLNDSIVAVASEGEEITRVDQVSDGATVAAVGGAAEVGTDTEGSFAFTTGSDSQAFTVEGDQAVTFNLDEEGNVIGVSEFDEDGVLSFNAEIEELAVNDAELTFETTTNASLSVVGGEVNYVKGVTDAIEGLENATVEATQAMTVNGTDVGVEGDDDYKIIVVDGEVVGLADISGDATVNVEAAVSIAVDQSGEFEIGGENYSFTDEDNSFTLTTDEEGKLAGVDALEGQMVIEDPADKALTVNGGELSFASTADSVTVGADATGITSIDGLVNNDAVYGDLGGASIAMLGSEASVRGEGSFLTVNDVTYELLNDADGITVTGGREVTDLNEEASLYVDQKGMYTVNGNGSDIDVEDTNLPIIGLDGATDAYIYDPANLIIRRGTPVTAIEQMLGLPTVYQYQAGTEEAPLTNAGLSALFKEDLDRPLEIFATNDEKGVQEIDLANTDFSKKVHLYDGDQALAFNNAGGNLAVVERENADGTETGGRKAIALGNGGDAVIMKADAGNGSEVGIVGGTGDDSVVVQGSAPTTFDMSAGGDDMLLMFASSNARVSLEGYNALANPNAGIRITERWTKDLAAAIANSLLNFGDGVMSIGNDPSANAQVTFNGNTAAIAGTFVNLFNYLGQKQAVGFTNSGGGLVDGSTSSDPLILIGNNKGDKTGSSTLIGGTGDDTAIAGGGDNIDLGAGNNFVNLQGGFTREGADITLAQGRTTISGFNGTFNLDHGDVIATDLTAADISFRDGNVYIESDSFYGVIADAAVDGAISYDAAGLEESADLVESADATSAPLATQEGDYTNVLFNNAGTLVKTAIAKEEGVIDVKLDFDARALNYIGENSGLTFYDHTGEVLVNLGEGTGSIDTDAALFSGINKVAAGAGQTTLIGAEDNETLIAGEGNDSIWGAGGKNLLVGYDDFANDKTGQTSFFVVAEADGAANTIRGFEFVDDDSWNLNTHKITADVLDIQVQYDQIKTENGGVDISGDDVVLFVNNRSKDAAESVVIEGARGKDFVVSGDGIIDDVIAQVNTDQLVADKFANYFVATGKNATLTVSNDIDTANIYLGGRPVGTDYTGDVPEFYGDIHVIDASGSNALVELGGNNYDNTIIGGSGDASMWGGDGGNDLLVGGTGQDTFFYNLGNGDDTVQGAKKGDIVDLSTIQIDDIVGEIGDGGVVLNFSDGGSLTVDSTDVEFKVSGDTYVVEDGEWKTK